MEKKLKFGILGLWRGSAPLYSISLIPKYAEVTAICEKNPAILEHRDVKPLIPDTAVLYDSYEEMLASGIDAVILCDYFHTHCKHAIQALEAGVAVFSETTAAPSLGDCVDLVEAVERTGGKYMLLANCSYFKPIQVAKKMLSDGKYGKLIYADGEYVHPVDPSTRPDFDPENLHWRQTLPATYYNMHSLGPLMYATGSVPVKVTAKAALQEIPKRPTNASKAFVITEMDNGAVFNTTGCVGVGTCSKWYRFACEKGTMETERIMEISDHLVHAGMERNEINRSNPSWEEIGITTAEELEDFSELFARGGHGGCDGVMFVEMLKYLKGEIEPFFDVYRSVALSAAGILGWYSVLDSSKEYEIPNFKIKSERDKVRGDYRKPFGNTMKDLTLPCTIEK